MDVKEKIDEIVKELEDQLKIAREKLDRADSNDPDGQIRYAREITEVVHKISALKNLKARLQ